jgi:ABC-type nitrate/sulfonate/bicarbonate transport system substrate-binding protein
MFRRLLAAGLVLLAPALLSADAPSAGAPTPLTFYPDWFPSAQFAGIYVALDRGYYRAAGLEVTLVPFAYGQQTPALIDAAPETCGLATGEGYIFLQKRAAGADLKALGAVLQRAPAGFMSLRATGIVSARDFAGRTIGVHKFADPLYRWFLRRAGLREADATMVFTGDDLAPLLKGELGAMQGFAIDEFVQLRRRVGDEARFLSFAELGFDSYSQLLYTTAPQIACHRDALRRFLGATRRGWTTALAEPAAALAALRPRLDPAGYDEALQRDSLATLRDYVAPGGRPPLAPLDRAKLARLAAACVELGFIAQPEAVERFLVALEPE